MFFFKQTIVFIT